MDPAFPDLVADWAASDDEESTTHGPISDDREGAEANLADPLTMLGKLEIAASRLW
jgi:hypothetical protein